MWWLQRDLLFKLSWSFQKQKTLFLCVSLIWWLCLTFTKPRDRSGDLVPNAQPLKINSLVGGGVRVNPTFSSGTAFSLSGLQNVPYQRYGVVLPAFQPQRPSFPFSPSHSFPESIQIFKAKDKKGCGWVTSTFDLETQPKWIQSLPHFNEARGKKKLKQQCKWVS